MKTTSSKTEQVPYRVIVWTERDGVTNVSPDMSESAAQALAATSRATMPKWAHVEVEAA